MHLIMRTATLIVKCFFIVMINHFFNVDWAVKYGDREAIMLSNIVYRLQANRVNNMNIHEGRVWTYNSRKAFTEIFPYWSEKQIYRIIQSLVEQGALVTGMFSKDKRDRTLWYSVNDDIYADCIDITIYSPLR